MKQTRNIQSWEVSDALWQQVAPLIPKPQRDPNREYQRQPGGGRKPLPSRQVFAGIVSVLRTGIQWNALPKERCGSPSAIHRYFLEWQAAGFFQRLWQAGLMEYDAMACIAWTWQSLDGALTKAPLAQEAVGPNPTDRGKKWEHAQPVGGRAWYPVVACRQRRRNTGGVAAARDPGGSRPATARSREWDPSIPQRGQRVHGGNGRERECGAGVYACLAATGRDDSPYPVASGSVATMGGGTVSSLAQSISKIDDSLRKIATER
jgi:transposase